MSFHPRNALSALSVPPAAFTYLLSSDKHCAYSWPSLAICSQRLWWAEGAVILGKKESHRGLMESRGLFSEKTASPLQAVLPLNRWRSYSAHVYTPHTHVHTYLGRADRVVPNKIFIWMDAGRETLFIMLQHNIVLFWVIWGEVFFFI